MSVCISRHGEFGSHDPDDAHTCKLCGVLDEEDVIAELKRLRAELADLQGAGQSKLFINAQLKWQMDNVQHERDEARAEAQRARTAVHRYFGHAGEVEACTVGICHAIVHPDATVPAPRFDLGNPLGWSPDEIRRREEDQAMFVTYDDADVTPAE